MRRLAWAIVILALIWCAWWVIASNVLQRPIATLLDDQHESRWQAKVSEISRHGFPLMLHTRLHDLSVADQVHGIIVHVPQIDLMAAAYWPGFMTVKLPNAPINFETLIGPATVQTQDAQADLRLHPGATLQLQSMRVISGAWQLGTNEGPLLSADDLRVTVTQDDITAETYQFDLNANTLTPGTPIRSLLSLPLDWPTTFETFIADLSVTFDTPWDRSALDTQRPQPRNIALRKINAAWGNVNILATGEVAIDPLGVPTGMISLTVTNWREAFDLAVASGALPTPLRPQAEITLAALANLGGSPNDLDLNLTFQNGEMSLGQIRLGPAPRVILR